jgi:hypothetical protein
MCLSVFAGARAQENTNTPSQKTKEAVEKLLRTPATVGKYLGEIGAAAKAKMNESAVSGSNANDASPPTNENKTNLEEKLHASPAGRRDPFRPFTLNVRPNVRRRENLSPLERHELGQLKLAGIVWNSKEPTAMVEDSAGLGYVVKIGTPIGTSDGTVKSIKQNEIIIEEFFVDLYGAKKHREVRMRISAENVE